MRRLTWWLLFMSADGGGGGAPPAPGGPPPTGNPPPGNPPPGGNPTPAAPPADWQTQIAAKDEQIATMRKQFDDLQKTLEGIKDLPKELESTRGELNAYREREARNTAIETAIKKATADGKFEVDRAKLEKVASLVPAGEKMLEQIQDLAETLKLEKRAPGGTGRVIAGQPPAPSGDDGKKSLDEIYRTSPEAFNQAVASRVGAGRFRGGMS